MTSLHEHVATKQDQQALEFTSDIAFPIATHSALYGLLKYSLY